VGEQRRLEFNEAVADFLSGRRNLRCVFVLIDSRLSPQSIDLEFIRWLAGCTVPFALVFTKTDKQSAAQGQANVDLFKKAMGELRADLPAILVSSAKTRVGRGEILNYVEDTLTKHNRSVG
jgi:GTP-binding protein